MTERGEYQRVKERVDELMTVGSFNEALGADQVGSEIEGEFGVRYSAAEIHAIWTQGQSWAADYQRWECCGNVAQLGHNELCLRSRKG